ncbi:MAG: cation diffusion facilitator family transporter [Minwuia sp.]|uniref:cation diffusion facilitator family transporter n=1 Tax=Minwuia sp. TaxID=2493630 RepID=UPI003A8C3A95
MAEPKRDSGAWMRLATIASVLTAGTMVAMKTVAFVMTGSTAMLGSLLDSILDMTASVVNMFAVRYSLTDADEEHRFGHGKAESIGALAQGALISGSAVFLAWESAARLTGPEPVQASNLGIAVMVISIALTLGLVMFQRFVVAKSGSVAISADLLHYSGDLLMNAGVILALVLSSMFGLHAADPIIGLLIAAWLLRGAWNIVNSSFAQLMDRELPEDERTRIQAAALAIDEVRAVHDLRTRQSGLSVFIQVHVELDGHLSLYRAHVIADMVEMEVQNIHPGAEVFVHLDPAGAEDLADMYDRVTSAELDELQPDSKQQSA